MLKVFIVDDESIIREGLRDNIPWQQYGFEFVGEASDGEMALPMIRKLQPDILITDIKMPFMDGLALSRIVSSEMPNIRIIIISGHDDFEYAQQAIKVGVEQYLLKPITRGNLQKVLLEIREKIEADKEQKTYVEKFMNDMKEYESYSKRNFMEKVFEGQLSTEQIYNETGKLSIDLNGSGFNIVLLNIQEKEEGLFENVQEEILRFFLRFPEYLILRWSINTYLFLLKGDSESISELSEKCIENIKKICEDNDNKVDWYVAVGDPVGRLSLLPECYKKVNHLIAHRFLKPSQRLFSSTNTIDTNSESNSGNLYQVDATKISPEIIKGFLAEGEMEEIEDFVSGYLDGLSDALKDNMFRGYLLLNFRFTVLGYLEGLNVVKEDFLKKVQETNLNELSDSIEEIASYMKELLRGTISCREDESANQSRHIMKKALDFIEANYSNESISLNSVSSAIGVSSNYFSGIFSQEMEKTFIEYVTEKRMEMAKKLLKETEMHSGEIAAKVGYKDSHYFSFVFKKTQGCTPREYRNK